MPDNLPDTIDEAERQHEQMDRCPDWGPSWALCRACASLSRPLIAYRAAVAALDSSYAERDRLVAELAAAKQASLEVDAAFAAQLSDRLSGIVDGLTAKLTQMEADLANERHKLSEIHAAVASELQPNSGIHLPGEGEQLARRVLEIIERGA